MWIVLFVFMFIELELLRFRTKPQSKRNTIIICHSKDISHIEVIKLLFNPRHDDDGNDDNDVDDECLVILEFHFIVMVLPVYTCCSELIIVPPTKASHSVSVSFCLSVFLSVLLYFGLLLWETGPQINIQNNGRCLTSTAPMEQKRYISILFVWISLNIHKNLFFFVVHLFVRPFV